MAAEAWERHARCRGLTTDSFFPDGKLGRESQKDQAVAIRFCHGCPVRLKCLDLALTAEGDAPAASRYGVFGGLTPAERHKLHERARKRAQVRSTVLAA
jgi:hypothetical protein